MSLTQGQREQIFILKLKLITAKKIRLNDDNITFWLTATLINRFQSAEIFEQINQIRKTIQKKIPQTNNKNELANAFLCLAITSEILKNGQAESKYRRALSYDQRHPQTSLSLAILLYHQQQYREALKYINKITVTSAFQEKHRENILGILMYKVENGICLQLRKVNNHKKQITKLQFIKKIMEFKEGFLYHCAEIVEQVELSQKIYSQLAQLLFYTNRFADGLTLARKLRNVNQPPTQIIQQNLTTLFFNFDKFEESVECANQGLRINPRNQYIHKYLIISLRILQKSSQAKVFAMKLMNTNAYNSFAYQAIGMLLSNQGNIQLALEYSELGVVIQQSEQTYFVLAYQLSKSGMFAKAQKYYLKSIKIQPNQHNYSNLGIMYFRNETYLNAMLCFLETITHNYQNFRPYLYLGLCASKSRFLTLVINMSMDKLKLANAQDLFLQVYLAAYKLISNQSHKQMYTFLSNFIEERKKGDQETLYSNIADLLIQLGLPLQNIKESIIFSLIFGVLSRAKEHYIIANQIFMHLVVKQASANEMSMSDVFTQLYQRQISKTPKELQSIFLQFIVSEMIQSSPAQALKCFHKSLSYAQGVYEQFYAQFYKMIEKDIEKLWPISIITNSIVYRQSLDQTNLEDVSDALNKHSFLELGKYTENLGLMAQIVHVLSQHQSSKQSLKEFHLFLAAIKGNHMTEGLAFNVKHPGKNYQFLFEQIRNDQEIVVKILQNLCKIYSQKGDLTLLKREACRLMELYFDSFILNQKFKLIFNHFHPYIITESCHKQFAVILYRIKRFPFYPQLDLMEDLQNMFKQGNKHTNKVFKVEYNDKKQELAQDTSEIESYFSQPFVGLDLQTRSQTNIFPDQQQSFDDSDSQQMNFALQSSKLSLQASIEQDQRNSRTQKQRKIPVKKAKMRFQALRRAHQNSSDQQSSNSQLRQGSFSREAKQDYENKQGKWYQLSYSPQRNKFSNDKKYGKFNKLLHQNTCCLIKFISQQSNLKYIAKHLYSSTSSNNIFHVKVEHGDEFSKIRENLQASTLRWIQTLGPTFVFRWIADIASGICELEKLGIYHADLYFRNTIKISKENGFWLKIIDFDKAFKVCQTGKNDLCYQCTKGLFDFWLRFRFAGKRSKAPIYDLYSSSKSSVSGKSSYEAKDIIEYLFVGADEFLVEQLLSIKQWSIFLHQKKINKCMSLLKEHMRVSHLKQFSQLVQQLLSYPLEGNIEMKAQTVDEVLQELNKLNQGKINYNLFAERVRIKSIGGLEQREGDDSQE